MEKKIKFQLSKQLDKKILKFINFSDGTKRTSASFKKNKIIFLVAKKEKNIIGCVPLEPRILRINDYIFKTFFITNAFILKKFQNLGIGSQLLNYYYKNYRIPLFAFRLMINDQASRWYKKNNFKKVYEISSYKLKIKKLYKYFISKKIISNDFKRLELNNVNKRIVAKILKKRKSNFLNNFNLYYNNYYKKYFKEINIFYKDINGSYEFCTIVLTNVGNNKIRYEIIDNNLKLTRLIRFLFFFINSSFYNKKFSINLKTKNEIKNIKNFFSKNKYKSNLITNYKFKNKKNFLFNPIEYV